MKKKTLFLGNGLNRTLECGFSWADLMKELGSTNSDTTSVPFPIEFEQLAAQQGCMPGRRNEDPYKALRQTISDKIESMGSQPNGVHTAFRNIGMNYVVTTNYDTIFEKLFDAEELISNAGSSRNILRACSKSSKVVFFHAHGLSRWKNTLCLSHEHYASLIGKIRNEFYPSKKDEGEETLSDLIRGNREPHGIWPELLFTTDVAIVGLELGYSESDLWWLLSLRSAIFSPYHKLEKYENRIMYYYAEIKNGTQPPDQDKLNALRALGVQPRAVLADSYPEAYERIAEMIKKEWNK